MTCEIENKLCMGVCLLVSASRINFNGLFTSSSQLKLLVLSGSLFA